MVVESNEPKQETGLPVATPLLQLNLPTSRLFWVVFLLLFVAGLFVPVVPLRQRQVIIWVVPVWAAYVFMIVVPTLAIPVAATHAALSFYIAKFIAMLGDPRSENSFSLQTLLILTATIAICLGVAMRFPQVGFLLLYFAISIAISVVSLSTWLGGPITNFLRLKKPVAHLTLCVNAMLIIGLLRRLVY